MAKEREYLNFSITINNKNGELILQEGNLLNLKIPKAWQKPDSNVNTSALWVCHLPSNSLGIVYISLYPNELVIKKNKTISEEEKMFSLELEKNNLQKENDLLIYRGMLENYGENEKENFYRCRLKLQKEEKPKSSGAGVAILIFLLILGIVGIIAASGGFN